MGRTTAQDKQDPNVEGAEGQEQAEEAQNGDLPAATAEVGGEDQTSRSNALRKAYGEATAELREKHRDEFDDLYVAAARRNGVDYKPKLKPEQKAEQDLEALLKEFPHLKDKVLAAEQTEA